MTRKPVSVPPLASSDRVPTPSRDGLGCGGTFLTACFSFRDFGGVGFGDVCGDHTADVCSDGGNDFQQFRAGSGSTRGSRPTMSSQRRASSRTVVGSSAVVWALHQVARSWASAYPS